MNPFRATSEESNTKMSGEDVELSLGPRSPRWGVLLPRRQPSPPPKSSMNMKAAAAAAATAAGGRAEDHSVSSVSLETGESASRSADEQSTSSPGSRTPDRHKKSVCIALRSIEASRPRMHSEI